MTIKKTQFFNKMRKKDFFCFTIKGDFGQKKRSLEF